MNSDLRFPELCLVEHAEGHIARELDPAFPVRLLLLLSLAFVLSDHPAEVEGLVPVVGFQ